jgi:uroporphyrinogen decarboxylase
MGLPNTSATRRMRDPFAGRPAQPPPLWLMRQAGRYLPEYREVRAKAESFLSLCYDPTQAAEVTLQPIRRYGFDAAIVFSDILVVPDALGQNVAFIDGEGPRLDPIRTAADLGGLNPVATRDKFGRVLETVARVRQALPNETSLIGFCGAPWTVATYMVAGRGSTDQADARLWAYRDPEGFQRLIDLLTEASVAYLSGQAEAGADVLQIFDTWAGNLPDDAFQRWVVAPTRKLVAQVKANHPGVPIIGFPRGAGSRAAAYITETGVDGIGCDTTMPLSFMRETLAPRAVVQGNLDPLLLLAGGGALDRRVDEILTTLGDRRFIFNLGHGILPQTPPERVARLVELVRR